MPLDPTQPSPKHPAPDLPEAPDLQAMVDAVSVIVWRADTTGASVFLNQSWRDYTGRREGQDRGEGWRECLHPEDEAETVRRYREAFEARRPFSLDCRFRRHDGVYRWFTNEGRPMHSEQGTFLGFIGSCTDITERKRLELEREQYQTLFNVASDLMVIADPKGCFLHVNPAALKTLGYSEAELLARPFMEFVHPDDRQATEAEMDRQLRRGFSLNFENRYLCKDGSTRWLSWRAVFVQAEGCTYATARDITEFRHMQEALKESEARYRSLFEQSQAPMLILDPEHGAIVDANPSAARFYGWSREALLRMRIQDINTLPPEEVDQRLEEVRSGVHGHYEFRHRLADGSLRDVESFVSPLHQGGRAFIYSIVHDITERKRAERALQEALAFNRQVIESAQEGIVVYDLEGRLIQMNPFMERMLGCSTAQVKGRRLGEIVTPSAPAVLHQGIDRALKGESVSNPSFEWTALGGGRRGWATSTQAPLRDGQGRVVGVIETVSDVTELHQAEEVRQKLQAELHQTQKLESLGSLAGGVAHDMNNVLAAIQAVTQTLQAVHGEIPDLKAALDTIERAASRGRDLVQGLTNFARKDLRGAERLDLNALVREESEILKRTTLQRVALSLDLEEPLPAVVGERSTLGSALMNLCVNAVDAMPGGGTLTLRTRSLPEGQVELCVQDTGTGMPPDVLARAMEPFFTTKPAGKGTGLGLALVYATASAHGGSFTLESEPGRGTRAQVRLPATTEVRPAQAAPEPEAPSAGPLNLLLVDDEALIREAVPGLLGVLGHRVTTAEGGAEALALLREGLRPDLVILDQNMPGMTGIETLRELRKQHPTLPVLLATGYLESDTAELLRKDGHAKPLSKPFGLKDLRTQIQTLFPGRHP